MEEGAEQLLSRALQLARAQAADGRRGATGCDAVPRQLLQRCAGGCPVHSLGRGIACLAAIPQPARKDQ